MEKSKQNGNGLVQAEEWVNRAGPWHQIQPPLQPWILDHLQTLGFSSLTQVQSSSIPLLLSHKDLIVEAITGSGKTLSFLIPLLELISKRSSNLKKLEIGGLIITPTRELATQIYGIVNQFLDSQPSQEEEEEDIESDEERGDASFKKGRRISSAQLLIGGTKSTPLSDYKTFKDQGPDILIGTPGRIEELLKRNSVNTKELELLILDEADRLLDLGFSKTLKSILTFLPKQRRTGLFSATMNDSLNELAKVGMRNPVRIVVKVEKKTTSKNKDKDNSIRTPLSLQNLYQLSRPENKLSQLIRLLQYEIKGAGVSNDWESKKFIIYFSTCNQVNYFYNLFLNLSELKEIQFFGLHGKLNPNKRESTYNGFLNSIGGLSTDEPSTSKKPSQAQRNGASVLLCTDVAARGLDLPDVDVVIQFDPPTDPKVFSHRCGRTARAGRKGRAIVMLNRGKEEEYVDFLQVRKIPLSSYPYLLSDSSSTSTTPVPGPEPSTSDLSAREFESRIHSILLSDRAIYELSIKAFVSFIKSYSKHETGYIFPLNQSIPGSLKIKSLAKSYGLLRLPRMPEISGGGEKNNRKRMRTNKKEDDVESKGSVLEKKRKIDVEREQEDEVIDGEEFVEIEFDPRTLAYKDKAREKQRLATIASKDAAQEEKSKNGKDSKKQNKKKKDDKDLNLIREESESEEEESVVNSSDEDEGYEWDEEKRKLKEKKQREKKRKERIQKAGLGIEEAWSEKKALKNQREERRLKRKRKRDWEKKNRIGDENDDDEESSSEEDDDQDQDQDQGDDGRSSKKENDKKNNWSKSREKKKGKIDQDSKNDDDDESDSEVEIKDWKEDIKSRKSNLKKLRDSKSKGMVVDEEGFFGDL